MANISNSFDVLVDYMLALLHLMDEVEVIFLQDALKEFGRRYQDAIPRKDKLHDIKGREKWKLRVEWARNDLASLELMGTRGRGIWSITEKGRAWLQAHPNGRDELLQLDREYRSKYHKVKGEDQLSATKINWKGKTYSTTREEVLGEARRLLAKGIPPEAARYQDWYAEVDGQRVSVKWLFHLITGAGYLTFMSNQACNTLKKLGIPTYHQNKSANSVLSHNEQLGVISIKWKGETYGITRDELLNKARGLLEKDNPPEATRYQDWYTEVDGQKISVKWLFHLITSAAYLTFSSTQACNTLKRLGIPTYKVNKSENPAPNRQSLRPNFFGLTIVLNHADRVKFFHEIKRLLPEKLPAFAQHYKIRPVGNNYLQVAYPELIRSHYELRFGRSEELAFHFEAVKLDANLARLEYVKPFESNWKTQLGEELRLEKRGQKWAQICLEWNIEQINSVNSHWQQDVVAELPALPQNDMIAEALKSSALQNPSAPLWQVKAHAYTDLLARFIEVTLPELQNAFPPIRRRRKKTAVLHHGAGGPDEHAHRFFDEKINEIRHFLEGRSIATPSHEVLCDWIQLCYFFGLFDEGHKIFPYVNELELNNDWLYHRTKKYAGVCRLNAARRS